MFLSSSSRIIFLIYVLCTLSLVSAESLQDVNKWLCADENCSDPIAISTAKKLYTPDDTKKISVNKGDKVQVLRKPADPSQKYYYVKSLVSNRKGLISKDFIREIEILHPDKTLIEVRLDTKSTNSKKPNINPSPPTTVYDGTTITDSYADNFHSYEPTQSQAHPNDAGSPSLVQSTTPPSVTNEDAPTVVDSVEVENRNAYEHESTYPSKEPSIIPNSSIIPDSALDGQMLSDDDKGISSTPASTIINEPSLLHDVPKAADTVQPTTEITVGPDPIPIHKSQAQENFGAEGMIGVEDVNGTSSDLQLDPPKEGETLFESATSKIISYLPFGNGDDTAESESEEKHKEADDKVVADREAMPSSSIIEKDLESMMAVGQDAPSDESVNTEKPVSDLETSTPTTNEADVELKASDLLEDLSEHVNDDHLASNLSSSSGPVDIADKDVPVTPTRDPPQSDNLSPVGSNMSDSQSTPSQSVDTEEQISFEDAAKPFDQENIHPPEQNIIKAESDEPLTERSPSSVEPKDAQLSQNNHVEDEPLPTKPQIHEVPAVEPDKTIENATDSEKSYSNMKFGSTDSQGNSDDNVKSEVSTENSIKDSVNATIEHSESPSQIVNSFESQKVVDEPTPLSSGSIFSSSLDFVDPRSSNPEIPTISSNEQVPAVTEERITEPEPTNIVVTANIDEPIQEVDENMTLPTSEPSYQTRVELPETTVSAQIETSPSEPLSLAEEDSSDTWYSSLMSSFGRIQEMVSGRGPDPEVIPSGDITPEVTPKFQVDEKAETCTTEACDHQYRNNQGIEQDIHYQIENLVSLSPRGLIVMVITTIAILLFSLGYYYLENLKRDVELVSKYNDLAGKLFIEQKEKEMLAEQLASVNESMTQISFDTTKYDEEIAELKILVQKYKEEKCTLEEKEKETRKKFMMVEKNYNELRNILSQNKQKGERSALILDIKNLKESIAGNNIEIASLKEQLLEKKEEIKSLNTRIVELKEANKQLEGNVEKAISENHDAAQKYQDNIAKLEKTIEESTFSRVKLEKECALLKKEKESLAIEKELAETSLQKFQRLKPSNSLTEWLDVKEVRVSLLAAEKKIEELTAIRDVLTREKTLMEDRERTLVVDLDQLNDKYEKAEKDKIEALTKLQVLSDYFKEKETQLQEELGTKESLWLQKQSDDRTIYEQMRALREENTSFKNQNETLKREILDQEASFKKLITSAEEKAHENWVALRHHERRLKEAQMEAAQLRSRLTALEATSDNSDDKMNKGEVNGDIPPFGSATSPPFMLYPEFVPPPPLLPNTPSRPPPLGRISSPPLGDFTPPPPLVPYEMFLPPSPPPPAPHVLHKPQPMDGSHRIQKDSQSSNHSSESVPDRPRRNKR